MATVKDAVNCCVMGFEATEVEVAEIVEFAVEGSVAAVFVVTVSTLNVVWTAVLEFRVVSASLTVLVAGDCAEELSVCVVVWVTGCPATTGWDGTASPETPSKILFAPDAA